MGLKPIQLVIVLGMCCSRVVVFSSLVLTLVLPTCLVPATVILLLVGRVQGFVLEAVSDHACLPTSVRLAVFTESSGIRIQTAARVNGVVSTLLE